MPIRPGFALLALCLAVPACGDDDGNGAVDAAANADANIADAATTPDASAPDASMVTCELPAAGLPGGPCEAHSDCDSAEGAGDGFCLADQPPGSTLVWPPEGYCMVFNGCEVDTDCPGDQSHCILIEGFATCVAACCEDVACGDGQLCSDRYFSEPIFKTSCFPGSVDAADGDPCEHNGDCNLHSLCLPDPFLNPGGYCQTSGCTIGDDSTCAGPGDGHCIDHDGDIATPAACVDACDSDSDCREAEGYKCFDDTAAGNGRYCRHPRVSDACSVSGDCGVAPWDCLTGADFPGGFCTVPDCTVGDNLTCPSRSICHDPDAEVTGDQYCAPKCDQDDPDSCRDGYSCTAVGEEFICLVTPT